MHPWTILGFLCVAANAATIPPEATELVGRDDRIPEDPDTTIGDVISVNITSTVLYPDLDLILLFYNNATCRSNPFREYTFTNYTTANVTWGDVLDDIHAAWQTGGQLNVPRVRAGRILQSKLFNLRGKVDTLMGAFNFTDYEKPSAASDANERDRRVYHDGLRRKILTDVNEEVGASSDSDNDIESGRSDAETVYHSADEESNPGAASTEPFRSDAVPRKAIVYWIMGTAATWGIGWGTLSIRKHDIDKGELVDNVFGSALLWIGAVLAGMYDVLRRYRYNLSEASQAALAAGTNAISGAVEDFELLAITAKVVPVDAARKTKTTVKPWGDSYKRFFGLPYSAEAQNLQSGYGECGADGAILSSGVAQNNENMASGSGQPNENTASGSGTSQEQACQVQRLPDSLRTYGELEMIGRSRPQCLPHEKGKGKATWEDDGTGHTRPDESDGDD